MPIQVRRSTPSPQRGRCPCRATLMCSTRKWSPRRSG